MNRYQKRIERMRKRRRDIFAYRLLYDKTKGTLSNLKFDLYKIMADEKMRIIRITKKT